MLLASELPRISVVMIMKNLSKIHPKIGLLTKTGETTFQAENQYTRKEMPIY